MPELMKKKKFRNFLASKPPKPQQTVTSTDGKLEISNVPKLVKKPAKKKTSKNCKNNHHYHQIDGVSGSRA